MQQETFRVKAWEQCLFFYGYVSGLCMLGESFVPGPYKAKHAIGNEPQT
jgi:hypothetical protein